MKASKCLICLFVVIVFVMGCNKDNRQEEEVKVPVKVENVQKGTVTQTLSFQGDIQAEFEVKVFSKIPDRIETFYVDEGDFVKKGGIIANVLATTIEQVTLQAEAQKTQIETEYSRAQRLYRENAMSQQQYDVIQTQMVQARAAYTSARSQLNDARILSPISGIVGKRYYDAGDMANPVMPVVTVVQMDRVKIKFDASEFDLGKLAVGQAGSIEVRTYQDKKFHGKVSKISPVLDPLTRMATVEVIVENQKHLLKPGMYADVEVVVGQIKDVIVTPRHSVLESTTLERENGEDRVIKNYFVFVANDSNRSEKRELNVLYVNHQYVAVDSGIIIGEKMVVEGHKNLRDDMALLIIGEEVE